MSLNKNEAEIEELVSDVKKLFSENHSLGSLRNNLEEMKKAFKITQKTISKTSKVAKSLSFGNKILNIPVGLEDFRPFVQSDERVRWLDWQTRGCGFANISDTCPFCTSSIQSKREVIHRVGKEYDKTKIKNLMEIIDLLDQLGDYFSENTRLQLEQITKIKEGLTAEHQNFLFNLVSQIDALVEKLSNLSSLASFQFKRDEPVSDTLSKYRIELSFLPGLSSPKTKSIVNELNESIDSLIEQAGILQGKVNRQRSHINKIVQKHQTDINGFLEYAGYKYKVELSGSEGDLKLRLLHVDCGDYISKGKQYLSFGERNAFALVLFMYECLSKKPDLIRECPENGVNSFSS